MGMSHFMWTFEVASKEATMTISFESKDKSSELEPGANIHKLARAGAAFRQAESDDGEMSAENLGMLLRQVSKTSTSEIDNFIGELERLRGKLQLDGNRIQHDIREYAALSGQVMQLTKIIFESVKKLPQLRASVDN